MKMTITMDGNPIVAIEGDNLTFLEDYVGKDGIEFKQFIDIESPEVAVLEMKLAEAKQQVEEENKEKLKNLLEEAMTLARKTNTRLLISTESELMINGNAMMNIWLIGTILNRYAKQDHFPSFPNDEVKDELNKEVKAIFMGTLQWLTENKDAGWKVNEKHPKFLTEKAERDCRIRRERHDA